MQISGLSANPLLNLGARPSASIAQSFALQSSSANISAESAKTLPPVQPIQFSMDMLLALQGEQEPENAIEETKTPTATERFLEEARKSPMERLREQIMKELGISEEDLAALPPDEKRAMEDKIREMIEEKLKQGMRESGAAGSDSAGDAVLDAALGQER